MWLRRWLAEESLLRLYCLLINTLFSFWPLHYPSKKTLPTHKPPSFFFFFFFLLVDLLSLSSSYTLLVQYFFFSLPLLIAPFAKLIEGIKSAVEEEVAEVGLRIYKTHKILSSVVLAGLFWFLPSSYWTCRYSHRQSELCPKNNHIQLIWVHYDIERVMFAVHCFHRKLWNWLPPLPRLSQLPVQICGQVVYDV